MSEPRVVRLRSRDQVWVGDERDPLAEVVHVDRGSNWGNPFIMRGASDEERDRVIHLFTLYAAWRLSIEPDWLKPLRGKVLGCWCAPKRCHGDILLRLANA